MGIWVRSQDKKSLFLSSSFSVGVTNMFGSLDNQFPCIYSAGAVVGNYPTEAEALRVIDEIQDYVSHIEGIRLFPDADWLTPEYVFHLPAAGFSKEEK